MSGPPPDYPRFVPPAPGNYPQIAPIGPPEGGARQTGPVPQLMPPGHSGPQGPGYPPGTPYPPYAAPIAPGYGVPMQAGFLMPRTPTFWMSVAGAVGLGCIGLGLLIGLLASGGSDEPAPIAAAGETPAAAKVAGGAAAPAAEAAPCPGPGPCPDKAAAGTAAAPGSLEVRVKQIEHPVVATAVAPARGSVERVHVKAGGAVTTGQKLYTLRQGRGARAAEAVVDAPAAGRIERRAARGDRVQKGDVLAQLVDPSVWLVVADVTSEEISTTWSCQVSTSEGRNSAPCRIEGVQRLGAQQSRVTATAMSDAAGWLQGGGQELLLALTPPADGTPTASAAPPPSRAVRTSADASAEADTVESDDAPQPSDPKPAAGIPALVPAADADAGP